METIDGYTSLTELYDAIENINIDICETADVEHIYVNMDTNGFAVNVGFADILLWSSEDQLDREYDEENDIYEPIEKYLRRAINRELETLKKIKL
jgi:hypothetical protein